MTSTPQHGTPRRNSSVACASDFSTYVERLHRRHGNGWTIYRAIGVVVAGGALPNFGLRWTTYDAHDEAAYATLRKLANRLQADAGR